MGEARKSSQAHRDLLENADYIAQDKESPAYRFLEAAERTFELLATFPHIGTKTSFENSDLADARLFPIRGFDDYLVIYRPLADHVLILRVVHGARDLDQLH